MSILLENNSFLYKFFDLLLFITVFYVNNWEGKSKGARSRGFPVRDDPSQVQGESDRRQKYRDFFIKDFLSRYISISKEDILG